MVEWVTEEMRPKMGMIRIVETKRLVIEGGYFAEGHVACVPSSGAAAIIHSITPRGDGMFDCSFSTGVYRHARYIDRVEIDHDCRRNDCEWREDEDGKWLHHDYSNDYVLLALPYWLVRYTKVGDEAINAGAAYREST